MQVSYMWLNIYLAANNRKKTIFLFKFLFCCILFLFPVLLQAQDSLSLSDCIKIALDQNITIKKTDLTRQQSELDLILKKTSFLPSLNATASRGYTKGNSLDYTSYTYYQENSHSDYYGLNTQLVLFNSFKQINALKSSKFNLQSSQELYRETADQISLSVAAQYLQIQLGTEQVKNAEYQLQTTLNLLERTKLMVQVGSQNKTKELEIKAQLANDEMSLVEAKNQLAQSFLAMKQLLNFDLAKPIYIKTMVVDPGSYESYMNINVDELIEQSVQNLPSVRKAKLNMESSNYNYKSILSARYPTILLQGSTNSRYSSLAKNQQNQEVIPYKEQLDNNFGRQVSINLNIPIFNNYQASYSIQNARINYDNAKLSYRETELNSRNSIYESWFLMNSAAKKYAAAENSLNASELLYEQTNSMYEQGIVNFYDWQQAKTNYNKAQNTYLGAKYEFVYRVKVFDYYRGIPISLDK